MGINDEIKDQTKKMKDMTFKQKVAYIWEYYKFWILGGIVFIIFVVTLTGDIIDSKRPYYLNGMMLNSNLAYDDTVNLDEMFAAEMGVDMEKMQLFIDKDMKIPTDGSYDQMTMAYQTKLVSGYAAGELDVVIGPIAAMATSANVDAYADLTKILPQSLLDELEDRGYEFYYFTPSEDDLEEESIKEGEPYVGGIYMDSCRLLYDIGQYGAYDTPTNEDERVIFTIPVNAPRPENAIKFLEFLIK